MKIQEVNNLSSEEFIKNFNNIFEKTSSISISSEKKRPFNNKKEMMYHIQFYYCYVFLHNALFYTVTGIFQVRFIGVSFYMIVVYSVRIYQFHATVMLYSVF